MDDGVPGLGRKVAKGAAWLVGLRVSSQLLDAVSLIILARLISPGDFGIVALAGSIVAAIGLIRSTGFGSALIQNQNATRSHYDTAWSIQICLSTACGLALLGAAPFAAGFFDNSDALTMVVRVAAVLMIVDGFQNIAVIDFQKKLRFRNEVVLRLSIAIVSKIATVAAAFYFLDYRALVAGMVASSVVGMVLSYAMKPYRPRFTFSEARSLFSFSAWVQLQSVLIFINNHSRNFIVGSMHGPSDVGLLNVSQNIATMTGATIQGPINQASYPAFAKNAHNLPALARNYTSVLSYVALLALPSSVGIALVAPHIVPLMLGEKWLGAIELVQILALLSFVNALTAASNPVFNAIGKPRLVAAFTLGRLCMLVPGLVVGAKLYGVVGVAWVNLLIPTMLFPFRQRATGRALQTSQGELVRPLVRPVLSTVAMAATVTVVDRHLSLGSSLVQQSVELLLVVLVGLASFVGALYLMWRASGNPEGPERDIVRIFASRLRRLRGRGAQQP